MFFQSTFAPGRMSMQEKIGKEEKARAATICRLIQHLQTSFKEINFTKWKLSASFAVRRQNVLCLTFRWRFYAYPFSFFLRNSPWKGGDEGKKNPFEQVRLYCRRNLNCKISMDFFSSSSIPPSKDFVLLSSLLSLNFAFDWWILCIISSRTSCSDYSKVLPLKFFALKYFREAKKLRRHHQVTT